MDAEEHIDEIEEERAMHNIDEAVEAMEEQDASSSHATSSTSKKMGRAPSKGVKNKTPMFLTFNEFGQPDGEWADAYDVQIGICVLKIDINEPSYPKMDNVTKQNFWEETKRLFHIIDPDGEREKAFHSVVGARFRIFKSRLVGRWIKFTIKPPKNSAHLMPWQVYKGFITEEQWEKFKSSRLTRDAENENLEQQKQTTRRRDICSGTSC